MIFTALVMVAGVVMSNYGYEWIGFPLFFFGLSLIIL